MKRLSKTQQTEFETHCKVLEDYRHELEEEINKANSFVEEANSKVQDKVEVLNNAIGEFNAFREGIEADAQAYHDDRSETWQEGEKGCAYMEWVEQWGDEANEAEVEYMEAINEPDDDFMPDEDKYPAECEAA